MPKGVFRVVIEASGPHGCEREMPDGSEVFGCGRRNCADCIVREAITELHRRGSIVSKAELVHYPDTPSQVTDDLITRRRSGSFPTAR